MAKQNKYADAAKRAQLQTDAEYEEFMSKITTLSQEQIQRLFPDNADQEKLKELLRIVNSSTNTNQKILKLKENTEKFGSIIFKLLGHLL